ncbi:MAG: hypothetical protein MPN21_16330 [Thermoanaerobaculia bacterium]|nr:hypothetical protein [Thermoanaerobaculia bacterium]
MTFHLSIPMPVRRPVAALSSLVMCCALLAGSVDAQVKVLQTDTREEAVEGTADGVAIGPLGQLELSPGVERLAGLDEPFVFSAAPTASGWLLGTGNDGKVFHVSRDGVPQLLATLPQPTVFAVLERSDGTRLAAGSPEAKVYRLAADQELFELFDSEASYVWDLAEDDQGRLLVATGLPGKVLRVELGASRSVVETLWESPDDHVRALHLRSDGSIWIGTAGQGRIVRIARDGSVRTLHDATHPEILAFAEGTDENGAAVVYAALLASEASLVDLSNSSEGEEEQVTPTGEVTVGSRGAGFQGPRSVVLRVQAEGDFLGRGVSVAEIADETIHSLHAADGDLWIGTGQEGALYRLRDDVLVREDKLDDRQIIALETSGGVLGAMTTDGASVYLVDGRPKEKGTYTSKVHDTEQPARPGVFRWRGEVGGGAVDAYARAGSSSEPDATWSDWIGIGENTAPGEDLSLAAVGNGRFIQWRTVLRRGSPGSPRIDATELSYRQLNQAPKIKKFTAKEPGQILVSQSFNPTSTVFEPWSPSRQGIFVTLDEDKSGEGNTKTLWKRGWRTLEWEADDANGDSLVYRLDVRSEDSESAWLPVVEELDKSYYSFDATVLPDGVYRFRLVASDGSEWPEEEHLESREISEPVAIDHSPPRMVSKSRSGNVLTVRVSDEMSPLSRLEVSTDAGEWRELRPEDGLADGHSESLRVSLPEEAELVLLRAMDASFNVVAWSLLDD